MKMQKRQFRIGELAKQLEVERFVVRFWEKEFEFNAHRSNGGQRFYEEKDLRKFFKIKELLYEKGFTITGAKKQLKEGKSHKIIASQKTTMPSNDTLSIPQEKKIIEQIQNIKKQLLSLKEIL